MYNTVRIDNVRMFVLSIIVAKGQSSAKLMERWCDAINRPGVDFLQEICDTLNDSGAPWAQELRRLLTIWSKSGPNLAEMLKADYDLSQNLKEDFRAIWVPTQSGRSYMLFSPHGDPRDPNSDARAIFMSVTLSADWEKFGGPCPRCDQYFIRKTAKRSIYCSHRCASQDTASKRTKAVRQEQHEDKLARAEAAEIEWEKLWKKGRTKKGWKEWVAASDPDITIRFLTRAVNKGELRSPAIEEREKNETSK